MNNDFKSISRAMNYQADVLSQTLAEPHKLNPAEWTYERLAEYIKDFETDLDNDHEIGARLVSFGHEVTFHIQDMGYYGPDIICFYGMNNKGEKLQLIQNIAQLSILLIALKKLEENPRRLGFKLTQKNTEEKSTDQPKEG